MASTMEALFDKATNPNNTLEDWEFIVQFSDRVNLDPNGPQKALKMVVMKTQSGNEKSALLALTVLEACVKNCGQRFHAELGKFRFLNEVIRMLSPKYLGDKTPPAVKQKLRELLIGWKEGLPLEPKIDECFEMLEKCGLITDPSASDTGSKPKVHLKMEKHKEELLSRLLHSSNPDDLRTANRLIREAVRKDEKRMEKLQKRLSELEEVQQNVKVLSEMLDQDSKEAGSESDRQLMTELCQKCEEMKPRILRMASQITSTEEGMAEALKTNDDLLRVLDRYKAVFGALPTPQQQTGAGSEPGPRQVQDPSASSTTSTAGASSTTSTAGAAAMPPPPTAASDGGGGVDSLLIDLDLPNAGAGQSVPSSQSLLDDLGLLDLGPSGGSSSLSDVFSLPPLPHGQVPSNLVASTPPQSSDLLADLGLSLGSLPPAGSPVTPLPAQQQGELPSLADLYVQTESLQLSDTPPLPIYSKEGLSITFHFAKNDLGPNVKVVLVSVMNSGVSNIAKVEFQAAVPKSMRVRLQPPTGRDLPAFNPLAAAPTVIKQIMLIACPSQMKIRLKYRFSFVRNGQELVEMGDVSNFPY